MTRHSFGVVPTVTARHAARSACISDNTDCTALTYHGGAVMHGERFYTLYWGPPGHAIPSAYRLGLNNWLTQVVSYDYTPGDLFAVNQQFYDNSGPGAAKRFVPYGITSGGQLLDSNPYPASGCSDAGMSVCLNDSQLRVELQRYITANKLPAGRGTEYFIFTPHQVGSCFDSTSTSCAYTSYCGYHSYIGTANASTEILYANMPWTYGVSGCDTNLAFGSGYANGDALDPVVGIWSHEASETMTDPNLNAWYQDGGTDVGYENGDKCAYVYGNRGYGSMTGLANNGLGYWNFALGTDQYLLQLEWDQRLSNCARSNTDTPPVVSITPTTARHGVATTFTARVTDPAGISTIAWSLGDGVTATTTAATVAHSYASAGSPTMTVTVTDGHGHGNQKKLIQTITVS